METKCTSIVAYRPATVVIFTCTLIDRHTHTHRPLMCTHSVLSAQCHGQCIRFEPFESNSNEETQTTALEDDAIVHCSLINRIRIFGSEPIIIK